MWCRHGGSAGRFRPREHLLFLLQLTFAPILRTPPLSHKRSPPPMGTPLFSFLPSPGVHLPWRKAQSKPITPPGKPSDSADSLGGPWQGPRQGHHREGAQLSSHRLPRQFSVALYRAALASRAHGARSPSGRERPAPLTHTRARTPAHGVCSHSQ